MTQVPFYANGRQFALKELSLFVRDVPGEGPPTLFLHGFPEHGGTWRPVVEAIAGRARCIVPDLRGYGRSDRPRNVSDYLIDRLIADVIDLIDVHALGKVVLVGHDWGGVLAWWIAALHPNRIARAVIVNAPHPAAMQQALIEDSAQRAASQYITRLRAPGSETVFLSDPVSAWAGGFGRHPAMTDEDRAGFLACWSQADAAATMIAWYRASPFLVPAAGEEAVMPRWAMDSLLHVDIPITLIWGLNDAVLLPGLIERSRDWTVALSVVALEDAGHNAIHDRPDVVAEQILAGG